MIGPAFFYVDDDDIVYIPEHNGGRISILTLDGERLARWGDGPVHRSCHGIWVDSHSDLYVVQPGERLLLAPTFIGCCLAAFGAYWGLSLGLIWFTPFIMKVLGFSQASAGLISALPWVMGATVVLTTGWLSQLLMARGTSSRLARGVLGSAPLVVGGLIVLMLPYHESPIGKIALLVVGGGLTGSIYVVCPAIIGEFTPVSQRAGRVRVRGPHRLRQVAPTW